MLSEKQQALEVELSTVHTSIEKLVDVLNSATRRCREEENHTSPSERKIGKFRMEIGGNKRKLADLQQLRCQRAQEELACRYLDIKRRQEEERVARPQLSEQEKLFSAQLTAAQEKIEMFDRKPSWELNTLRKNLRRMVVEPLKRELEAKLAAAEAGLNQARHQAEDLVLQLETLRGDLILRDQHEVTMRGELDELFQLGETHYRMLKGSPAELRKALRQDWSITVDRWAVEELLQQWERGFTDTLGGSGSYGDLLRTIKFEVREATILYWFDTGEVVGSVINSAMGDGEIWPKGGGVPFNLEREALEQKRAAQAAQPVGV